MVSLQASRSQFLCAMRYRRLVNAHRPNRLRWIARARLPIFHLHASCTQRKATINQMIRTKTRRCPNVSSQCRCKCFPISSMHTIIPSRVLAHQMRTKN